MKTEIKYEWTVEEMDGEDIVDQDFQDRLSDFKKEDVDGKELGLVRNEGEEINGLKNRYYAYVKDGKLPEFFEDSNIKIPAKFHKELSVFIS